MSGSKFEVVFSGEIKSSEKRSVVEKRLRSRLGLSRREVKKLLGRNERVVKRINDRAAAAELAARLSEAGAICELRRGQDGGYERDGKSMVSQKVLAPRPNNRIAIPSTDAHTETRKTLRQHLDVPFQTATGSWRFLRLNKPEGTSTRDLTEAAAAALGRLKSRFHDPASKSYTITRVLAGAAIAVPTGGIALGVGSGMLMDGAWVGGLFNLVFFGAIALYGIWMVVGGLRLNNGIHAVPAASGTATAAMNGPSCSDNTTLIDTYNAVSEDSGDRKCTHPRIRSFMAKRWRTAVPCAYACEGTHLWGVTQDRRCENVSLLITSVAICLVIGFWIPEFQKAALGLLLLMLVAAALSRVTTKPTRQFHLDLANEPPSWSSNDDEFWAPIMEYFELRENARRRFWLKRKRGG